MEKHTTEVTWNKQIISQEDIDSAWKNCEKLSVELPKIDANTKRKVNAGFVAGMKWASLVAGRKIVTARDVINLVKKLQNINTCPATKDAYQNIIDQAEGLIKRGKEVEDE